MTDDANGDATLAVELTPPGRAAVAVVLVAGPRATKVVNQLFMPSRDGTLDRIPFETIVLGRWNSSDGEELVACRRTHDRAEIHCHGGAAAVGAVIESLVERGCRCVSWPAWLQSDRDEPIKAAAQIALAKTPTARTATILLDQYHGALAAAVSQAIEAATARNWSLAVEIVGRVLHYCHVGEHLTSPWRVVLAGRTNVGKSSLINALAGFERSIVSRQPGTTRDVVTTATAIDGWPVELADTAGIRTTDDELELAGVRLALATLQSADVIVAVEDAGVAVRRTGSAQESIFLLHPQLHPTRPVIHVWNKSDLLAQSTRAEIVATADAAMTLHAERGVDQYPLILTSAVTGDGIADLVTAIGQALVPVEPLPGSAVPFTAQQISAFEAARAAGDGHDLPAFLAALQPLLAPVKRRQVH